jgi:PPM family protein phosphatase
MSIPELDGRPVEVTMWARTDTGRTRSENQDTFLLLELRSNEGAAPRTLAPDTPLEEVGPEGCTFALGSRGALLLVADGMGGAAGGATASREGVRRIRDVFAHGWGEERERTPSQFAAHLARAVEDANRHLHGIATEHPEYQGMGTTLTAAGLLDEFVYFAQVGDSRGYLIREGRPVQLTRDQSVVQELVDTGALTEEQARRSHQRNVILQALGTQATVDVALTYEELRRGDLVLLCSDGLSGVVEPEEIARYAAEYPSPPELCDALVRLANERGGPDNITIAVARLAGPGLRRPSSGEDVVRRPFSLEAP